MEKITNLLFFLLLTTSLLTAQSLNVIEDPRTSIGDCGTDFLHEKLLKENPEYRKKTEEIEQKYVRTIKTLKARPDGKNQRRILHTIPVVVHVMHFPGTPVGVNENLSMATIEQGMQDLNDAFRNVGVYAGGPFHSNAGISSVDTEFEFCLAEQDPSGNPTDGVVRVETSLSNLFRDDFMATTCTNGSSQTQDGALKELSYWDSNDYLNIWLVNEICRSFPDDGCGVAGYAYLAGAHGACFDGVVNEARFFGTSTDNSKVHIHEVGHYLNLYHTFNDPDGTGPKNSCKNDNCLTEGDFVCDTPPDAGTTAYNCGAGDTANTCSTDADDPSVNNPFSSDVQDLYEDYMDYGFQSCQNTFTQGQKDRMKTAITGVRNSLNSSPACVKANASVLAYYADNGILVNERTGSTVSGCRTYQDINIEVRLYNAATAATSYTVGIAGGTATNLADYELPSNIVSFAVGESSKTFVLRIYNDKAIEGTETIILNLSGTGLASFNQTYSVSIIDDDSAPSGDRPVIFSDDFEAGAGNWGITNVNGSSVNGWFVSNIGCLTSNAAFLSNDSGVSNNYTDDVNFAGPWLRTTIDATGYTDLELTFDYAAGGSGETPRILADGGGGLGFAGSTAGGVSCAGSSSAAINMSSYDNSSALTFGFWWHMDGAGTVTNPGFTVDNVEVTAAAITVESVQTSSASEYLGPFDDVYFISGDGELMVRITNLSNHDYGCTTVTVDTDGTTSFTGGGGTSFAADNFVDKTFSVVPTNNNPSGAYDITLYYTETEIAGWETATGGSRAALAMIKSSVSIPTADGANSLRGTITSSNFAATPASYGYSSSYTSGFSSFGLSDAPPSSFPVELLTFTGQKNRSVIDLVWQTASEINSDYFEVQRSTDGSRFTAIGKVNAVGNSTAIETYSLVDEQPNVGTNFYRLKIVDTDGTFEYSDIIQIGFNENGIVKVYPNPVRGDRFLLEYDATSNEDVNIMIFDALGRVVSTQKFEVDKGINVLTIPISDISNGIYLMETIQGNFKQSAKITKLK